MERGRRVRVVLGAEPRPGVQDGAQREDLGPVGQESGFLYSPSFAEEGRQGRPRSGWAGSGRKRDGEGLSTARQNASDGGPGLSGVLPSRPRAPGCSGLSLGAMTGPHPATAINSLLRLWGLGRLSWGSHCWTVGTEPGKLRGMGPMTRPLPLPGLTPLLSTPCNCKTRG